MERVTIWSTFVALVVASVVLLFIDCCEDCECRFDAPSLSFKSTLVGLVWMAGGFYFFNKYQTNQRIVFKIDRYPETSIGLCYGGVPLSCNGIVKQKERVLQSTYVQKECVYYHSIMQRYVRTKKSGYWRTDQNIVEFVTFYVEDKSGKVLVDLTNMDDDFSSFEIVRTNRKIPDPNFSEIDCDRIFYEQIGNVRRYEFALSPETAVFLFGFTEKKEELAIKETEEFPLIISKKSKEKYVDEFFRGEHLSYFVSFFAMVGATIFYYGISYFLNFPLFLLLILYLVFMATGATNAWNRLVELRNRMESAYSSIDVELTRRTGLIPNLVKVVGKYKEYEKELFENVTKTRAGLNEKLNAAYKQRKNLVILVEAYPELGANATFKNLMKEVIETEDRIAYERAFYNRTVLKYNSLIEQFPYSLLRAINGAKKEGYLDAGEKEVVGVSFQTKK